MHNCFLPSTVDSHEIRVTVRVKYRDSIRYEEEEDFSKSSSSSFSGSDFMTTHFYF